MYVTITASHNKHPLISMPAVLTVIVPDQEIEDKAIFDDQMAIRSNFLILNDNNIDPTTKVDEKQISHPVLRSELKWINRGELLAGSFVAGPLIGNNDFEANDIDIYFKSHKDAIDFAAINKVYTFDTNSKVALRARIRDHGFNLIYGITYDNAADLIYRFDIRACSMAFDPNLNKLYWVHGAVEDAMRKRIVYNPCPHNTSLARLIKYTKKGFFIDPHQRLFLIELIKSNAIDPNLELISGYRAVP